MAADMRTPRGVRTQLPAATGGGTPRILVVGAPSAPDGALANNLRAKGCRLEVVQEADLDMHLAACGRPDVVLVAPGRADGPLSPQLLICLERLHVPVLMLGGEPAQLVQHVPEWLCDNADPNASADELFGRVCTLAKMAKHARRMHAKLRKLRRVGRHLQCNYAQIDNELLLAGQLQRDFLPTHLPEVPGLQFATLMRPYSWVSGDIYDIFRIDENHVGMYVADAVGHGVAAGLLTMFIKQAVIPKRISNNTYRVVSPAEVLHVLNQAMTIHNLPNCQYVTICYCVIDVRTRKVQVACAAHPNPILLSRDGQFGWVECDPGCVIGVFPQQQYEQTEFVLEPGQRMIVYSDGMEEAFGHGPNRRNRWLRLMRRNAGRDIRGIFGRLQQVIDRTSGSLHPQDDITAIGVEAVSATSPPDAGPS